MNKVLIFALTRKWGLKINCLKIFLTLATLFQGTICLAQTLYSIEYAPDSPIKSIPLNNAKLKLEIYAFEKPHGYLFVETNDKKQFSLDKAYDFAIQEIAGEEKYNALCSGNSTPADQKITITCVSREDANKD